MMGKSIKKHNFFVRVSERCLEQLNEMYAKRISYKHPRPHKGDIVIEAIEDLYNKDLGQICKRCGEFLVPSKAFYGGFVCKNRCDKRKGAI
jgi:hypothetical protein